MKITGGVRYVDIGDARQLLRAQLHRQLGHRRGRSGRLVLLRSRQTKTVRKPRRLPRGFFFAQDFRVAWRRCALIATAHDRNPHHSRHLGPDLTLLSLIWGGSFLAIRTALDEIPPLASVTHRVLWAAVALWIVVLVRQVPIPRDPRVWAAFLVMGCLNNVIPFSLMAWGQLHIETGLTAILNASTAIWGVLVAALVFADERLTMRKVAGVIIGFAGVAMAIGLHNMAAFDLRSLAQIAVIGGTISYALAGSWARARLKGQTPLVASAGMLTGSTLVMLPLAWGIEGPLPFDMAPPDMDGDRVLLAGGDGTGLSALLRDPDAGGRGHAAGRDADDPACRNPSRRLGARRDIVGGRAMQASLCW